MKNQASLLMIFFYFVQIYISNHHHHHHLLAAEQVITRFLNAHWSSARQVWLSHPLIYQLHDILTPVGCKWCKRCVDDPASFYHEFEHKKHIFMQALPLEDEGCFQWNLAGPSLHNTQEANTLAIRTQDPQPWRRIVTQVV